MQPAVSHRLFDRLTLGVMVVLVALPLTYLEVTHPSRQQLSDAMSTLANRLSPTASTASAPASQPAAAGTAASATHSSSPAVTAAIPNTTPKTATTNSYVHLRAGKSVTSAILTNIVSGTTVQLTADADPTWQGVTYQGKNGYIYRAYLQY